MQNRVRGLVQGALLAALYGALSYLQFALLPGSGSFALQLRVAEALCVLALFTPAAAWGLGVGCFLFNVANAGALPLDAPVGAAATVLSCLGMYYLRNVKIKDFPIASMLLPALGNGLLVGWELTVYVGGAFWLNALYVALGEGLVLFTLGTGLYWAIRARGLDKSLFSR